MTQPLDSTQPESVQPHNRHVRRSALRLMRQARMTTMLPGRPIGIADLDLAAIIGTKKALVAHNLFWLGCQAAVARTGFTREGLFYACASKRAVARMSRCSETTVAEFYRWARAAGWIFIEPGGFRIGPNGEFWNKPNFIAFNLGKVRADLAEVADRQLRHLRRFWTRAMRVLASHGQAMMRHMVNAGLEPAPGNPWCKRGNRPRANTDLGAPPPTPLQGALTAPPPRLRGAGKWETWKRRRWTAARKVAGDLWQGLDVTP